MRSNGKILVVDDEEIICNTLRIYLESEGFDVKAVQSGREAVELLEREKFEVLILDILMPQMNGLEIMHWIKERRVPVEVVVTTGAGSHDIGVEAMRLGAFELLRKPILDLDEKLLPAVRQAAERHRLRTDLDRAAKRTEKLERWFNELYHFGSRILRAPDDSTLVALLGEATRALVGEVEFILYRACGDDTYRAVGRTDLEPVVLEGAPRFFADTEDLDIPLSPSVALLPLEVKGDTVGIFAIGALTEENSEQLASILPLFPAVTCHLVYKK